MTLSLGIDIGTSGVRTAVLDDAGTLVSMARSPHPPQDAENINAVAWWQAVQSCIAAQVDALAELGLAGTDIGRIAIDGTSGSMTLVDADLRPVGPALMYNSKGFEDEARRISHSAAPDSHITQGANSALARAMRLVVRADDTPRHLLHQADYIAAKLIGHGGPSDHNNALKTGFDPQTGRWADWVGTLIDPCLLPDVVPVGTEIGQVSHVVAARLGIAPGAIVHAGTTDSIAAFLAAAPLEPGAAVTSIGSTLALKIISDRRIDLPEQGLYSHKLGPFWLAGGASNTGGAVLAHFFAADDIAALSARIDPSQASGLDYYPLLSPGERFPTNDPYLQPRLEPRPRSDAQFLHGLFEGIARIEADGYRLIREQGGPDPQPLFTAGGGARNDVLRHIRASCLDVTPQIASQTEAAIGAARICHGLF